MTRSIQLYVGERHGGAGGGGGGKIRYRCLAKDFDHHTIRFQNHIQTKFSTHTQTNFSNL